jgi:RNA recognition motif-containing protein
MKLFVGNLPFSITKEKLKEIFEQFGEITSLNLITDRDTGKSRGFAFVEFADKDSGNKAIKEYNGTTLDGRSIVVKIANDKPAARPPRRSPNRY